MDDGHSCRIWAPWSIIKSPYNLEHHLKSSSQGIRVWNSSEVVQSCKTLEKSKLVNCGWFYGFDGWKWFERAYSCPNRPHVSWESTSWKNLKQIRKFPKIETGPVILTAKNGNFLSLNLHHDTSFKWIFAQHESWRSCSPISKKSKNTQFPCMVGKYDQFIFKNSWTSKGHISQTIWPNLVGFFPTNHIFPPLSKNINFMSQNFTNQNGIFWPFSFKYKFDQELTFWFNHL